MGLLPIIYTAVTIFTIGLTVILTISYILYKLNPNHKKPYRDNLKEAYYIQQNSSYNYKQMPAFENAYDYDEPKRKIGIKRNNYNSNKSRFEILNNFNSNYYQPEKTVPHAFNYAAPFDVYNFQKEYSFNDKRMSKFFN